MMIEELKATGRSRALVRRLDTLILLFQIFLMTALSSWRSTPMVGLAAVIAVTCMVIARLVIEHRSGVTIKAQGSTPTAWLLVAAIPACVWWFTPAGSMVRSVTPLLVALALALGVVQFFKDRSARAEPTIRTA
jgi:hypothetical protein